MVVDFIIMGMQVCIRYKYIYPIGCKRIYIEYWCRLQNAGLAFGKIIEVVDDDENNNHSNNGESGLTTTLNFVYTHK